ncbi:MAG TPA: hypothetical protein VMI33_14215, partial [Streptosporangiaceae bacterium]|nr:hypothetical protein [Streptosporangiaceae bacterium]
MTAEAKTDLAADLIGVPSLTLHDRQLGDLELLLSGAFAPLTGFMGAADVAAVAEHGTLADGTPWPVAVTLDVREDAVPAGARQVVLADPEGAPLALLDIAGRDEGNGLTRLSGPVTALREPEHGPFRRLMLRPAQARAALGDVPVLAYATRGPLHSRQIGQLRHAAGQLKARVLLLPLTAGPAEVVTRPEALVRAALAAAESLPAGTLVIPVPLALRGPQAGTGPARELAARALVAGAFGASYLMVDGADAGFAGVPGAGAGPAGAGLAVTDGAGLAIPAVRTGDWAYDPVAEVWRPLALIEAGTER